MAKSWSVIVELDANLDRSRANELTTPYRKSSVSKDGRYTLFNGFACHKSATQAAETIALEMRNQKFSGTAIVA